MKHRVWTRRRRDDLAAELESLEICHLAQALAPGSAADWLDYAATHHEAASRLLAAAPAKQRRTLQKMEPLAAARLVLLSYHHARHALQMMQAADALVPECRSPDLVEAAASLAYRIREAPAMVWPLQEAELPNNQWRYPPEWNWD